VSGLWPSLFGHKTRTQRRQEALPITDADFFFLVAGYYLIKTLESSKRLLILTFLSYAQARIHIALVLL